MKKTKRNRLRQKAAQEVPPNFKCTTKERERQQMLDTYGMVPRYSGAKRTFYL